MQTSDNFDLDLYEGSDIFNPLIVENGNMEKIDEQMFLNSIASIGQAVELKNGTVHALTRENPDASMFRFVATSKFDRGDTFTVDGIQVSGLRTDGKTLDDGAYVINSNVLCCLTGTVLTLFVATGDVAKADDADRLGGELPSYYGTAADVQQANTVAQAAGVLANQVNSNLTDLQTLDFTETSIPSGTTFNEVVQMLMNKIFTKTIYLIRNGITESDFNTTMVNNSGSISPSQNSGFIRFSYGSANVTNVSRFSKKIKDIGEGRYLHIVARNTTTNAITMYVSDNANSTEQVEGQFVQWLTTSNEEHVIDLANYTNAYLYITAYGSNNRALDITNIWLASD